MLKRCEWNGIVHAVVMYRLIDSNGMTACGERFHSHPWQTFGDEPNATKRRANKRVTCFACIGAEG